MRLFWKLFCSMIAITALACSLGGYLLVDNQFQTALDSRAETVVMENSLLRHSLMREMQLGRTFDRAGAARLADSVTASVGIDGMAFRLTDEAGQELAGSRLPAESHLLQALGEKQSGWEVLPAGDSLYLHAASPLRLTDGLVYLETWRDVDDVFQARQAQYHVFFYLMLFLILAVGLLALAVSAWLSQPLKRLSEATKKVAAGELSERVQVYSDDEIGQLSADFNIMAEQMERQVRELTDAARRQEDFLHSFAHETKTPLTSIIGYAELLRSRPGQPELVREGAAYIYQEGRRLESLSWKLMDMVVLDRESIALRAEAILLTPDLYEIDPVSGFVVTDILHRTLQAEDDGTAMFLLTAGQQILRVMEEPLRVQNYLRNIMEVTFDGTAGLTPAEQYEKLRETYADIARICDPAKLPRREEPLSIRLRSLMELWMLVLALYFEQDKQRICRCDYCWGYFIPKTKKATRYCDRVTDGQSCKQRGANLARLDKTSEDEALLIYKKLRDRMYSRLLRWIDAAPSERSNLIPMDYEQYDRWSENARLAREEYVQGKLTAEEFLRKIDTTHELTSYEAGKIDLPDGPSRWQQLVARNFRFDPERYFPEKMAHLNLSDPDPQWQILTADDLRRKAQKGHQSLKEKYGK